MFDFQISGNNEENAGFGVKQRIKKLKSSNKKYMNNLIKLAKVNYTFDNKSEGIIRYNLEKALDNYEATMYLSYPETKNNIVTQKEIKVNVSFNSANSPSSEYQCEPTEIYLNNIRFPLDKTTFNVISIAQSIVFNSSFFKNGISNSENPKCEIFTRTPYATLLDIA